MNTDRLDANAAQALLRSYNVQGTEAELNRLISLCDYHPLALERVGVILDNLANNQASCIDNPDVLEAVINGLVRSEFPQLAWRFYHAYPGKRGYVEDGLKRADFRLGLRLASAIRPVYLASLPESARESSPESRLLPIKHEQALFLIDLGELKQAETILWELAFEPQDFYNYPRGDHKILYQYAARQNLCDLLILRGNLREAEQLADGMIQAYESDLPNSRWDRTAGEILFSRLMLCEGCFHRQENFYSGSNPYARRAIARTLQGKVRQALADFKQAEAFFFRKIPLGDFETYQRFATEYRLERLGLPKPQDLDEIPLPVRTLIGQAAIFYALLLTRLGKLDTALKVLNYSKRLATHPSKNWPSMAVYAELGLSDIYRLKGEYELAQQNLEHPLEWTKQTGQQELSCWASLSLAKLKHALHQLSEAENALDEAYSIATRHGFKLYEIDCLVSAGWIALSQQDLVTAENKAKTALDKVSDPDMAYAWGHGNALHLMGEVLFQKNELKEAQEYLTGALKLRERIEDPRLRNTQELLSQISNTTPGT